MGDGSRRAWRQREVSKLTISLVVGLTAVLAEVLAQGPGHAVAGSLRFRGAGPLIPMAEVTPRVVTLRDGSIVSDLATGNSQPDAVGGAPQ